MAVDSLVELDFMPTNGCAAARYSPIARRLNSLQRLLDGERVLFGRARRPEAVRSPPPSRIHTRLTPPNRLTEFIDFSNRALNLMYSRVGKELTDRLREAGLPQPIGPPPRSSRKRGSAK
jgi:hypothetical protein